MKINTNKGTAALPIASTEETLCKIGIHRLDLTKETPTCIECGQNL